MRPAPPHRRDKRSARALTHREWKRMRVYRSGRSRYAERRSVYENGAPTGGVSPRRALSLPRRRFLSENAAAIESRACRVLSSGSRRVSVTRAGSLIRDFLARRHFSVPRFARDSLSPLFLPLPVYLSSLSLSVTFPSSGCRSSSRSSLSPLSSFSLPSPLYPSPTLTRAVRTASARFDSPRVSRTESRLRILDRRFGRTGAVRRAGVYR